MTAQLTVHNAEIHTATAQVKTLTISGKQVTLAVFRQLREESLIADDGTLNGIPWGTVNYHPDKCNPGPYESVHWHVVWQRDQELLRAKVSPTPKSDNFSSVLLDAFYSACAAFELLNDPPSQWFGGKPIKYSKEGVPLDGWWGKIGKVPVHAKLAGIVAATDASRRKADGLQKRLTSARETLELVQNREAQGQHIDPGLAYYQGNVSGLERHASEATAEVDEDLRALRAWLKQLLGSEDPAGLEALWGRVEKEATCEAGRRQRDADVRKALGELPQLFIAV